MHGKVTLMPCLPPYTLGIQLKVIFLGHPDTGKSILVECLSTVVPHRVGETKQEEFCETPHGTPFTGRDVYRQSVSPKPSYCDITPNTPPLMTAIPSGGYAPGLLHNGQQVG